MSNGLNDFRAIADCSNPEECSVNNYMDKVRMKLSYNSVADVTDMLYGGDYMSMADRSNMYRVVNIHPNCRERHGLSWVFDGAKKYLWDYRLCTGLSSSPHV